jgi:hypothetical protein
MDPKILAILGEWMNRANQAAAPAVDWVADLGVEAPTWQQRFDANVKAGTIKGRSLARENAPWTVYDKLGWAAQEGFLSERKKKSQELDAEWQRATMRLQPEFVSTDGGNPKHDLPWRDRHFEYYKPPVRKMPPPPTKQRTDRDDALVAYSQKKKP